MPPKILKISLNSNLFYISSRKKKNFPSATGWGPNWNSTPSTQNFLYPPAKKKQKKTLNISKSKPHRRILLHVLMCALLTMETSGPMRRGSFVMNAFFGFILWMITSAVSFPCWPLKIWTVGNLWINSWLDVALNLDKFWSGDEFLNSRSWWWWRLRAFH